MRTFFTAAMGAFILAVVGPAHAADDQGRPATIHVRLPANAILTVNGEVTKSTSDERAFVTPDLDAGRNYVCTLKAEFLSGDSVVTVERKVLVWAGADVNVALSIAATYSHYYRRRPSIAPVYIPPQPRIGALEWPTTWTGR